MTPDKLKIAVAEAKRFLDRARKMKAFDGNRWFTNGPVDAGRLRRSSLDLTRALADLRRP